MNKRLFTLACLVTVLLYGTVEAWVLCKSYDAKIFQTVEPLYGTLAPYCLNMTVQLINGDYSSPTTQIEVKKYNTLGSRKGTIIIVGDSEIVRI